MTKKEAKVFYDLLIKKKVKKYYEYYLEKVIIYFQNFLTYQ